MPQVLGLTIDNGQWFAILLTQDLWELDSNFGGVGWIMELRTYRLGELCQRLSSGKAITAADIKEEGKYLVYGANGSRGYTDSYNFDGACAVIGRQGAYCGNVKYVEGQVYMSEHAVVAQANIHNDSKYLAYKLGILQLGRFSGQAAQPGLSVQRLSRLLIEIPSKEIQQKIANILSRYDEAIENNNKRVKLLEQMAQNLYKEWFVRFRFPGYENCEFENGIPKGWKVEKAQEIFDITIGRTPDRKQFEYFTNNEQDMLWVSISDMKDNMFILKSSEYLTNEAVSKVNMPMVKADTVLLSFKLSVGRVSITTKLSCTNEAIAHFNTSDKVLLEYTYLYLKLFNYQNLGNTSAIGTAINSTIIKNMKVVVPNRKLIEMFHNSTKDIFAIIKKLNYSNENLAKQRDLLLPRLMSGKLEV